MPKAKPPASVPATPTLSLAELLAHFRPNGSATPVDPSRSLDLIMELLAQDLLNARLQGQPFEEKLLRCLLRYEALRIRRESLALRKSKTKPAALLPEDDFHPIGAPDPAPPEVVEYVNNIRRQMWGTLPEDSPPPTPVTLPAPGAEPAPAVSAETAVTTEDSTEIPGTPEYEAKMAAARVRIQELEAERDRLNQEAEDRWLRIQAIEAKQKAEQQAAYDPRPFRNLLKRRRSKYDCL